MPVTTGSPLSLGDLIVKVKGDLRELQRQLASETPRAAATAGNAAGKGFVARFKAQMSAGQLGKGLAQGFGVGAGLGAATAVAAAVNAVTDAITGSFGAAAKFEDQLGTINTIAHFTDEALGELGDGIQRLAVKAGKSTDDLTAGFYDLVSAGIDAGDAMGVLEDAAVLSTGALSTTEQAVDLLTTAINAFGLQASDSTRLADIFAQTVQDGKVTAAELAASLADVAPIAHAAGVSIEEVAATYAVMTANGVPAAEAAQNLRQAINALISPNAALNRIQKATGINFAELMKAEGVGVALDTLTRATHGNTGAMSDALGRVQALQVALLIGGDRADEFAESTERMTKAGRDGGVAMGQLAERADTAAFKQRRLDAAVQVLNQRMGEFMLGPGGDFLNWLADMASGSPAVEGRLAEVYRQIGLVEQAAAKAKDEVDDGDAFMNWVNPHEVEFRGFIDQWGGLAERIGLTRQELRKMAEDAKLAAQSAGDLRPTAEVLQDLGLSLLAISIERDKVNKTMTDSLARLSPSRWGMVSAAVDDTNAALLETQRLWREAGQTFRSGTESPEEAVNALAGSLELVANTSLPDVRDAAKATAKAIREAFQQEVPTIKALAREEQRLAGQRRRAMAQGRFDIVAMIDARLLENRTQQQAYRDAARIYRQEQRDVVTRKRGLKALQAELGLTQRQAAKVYDEYNGDVDEAISQTKALDRLDPTLEVRTEGVDAAVSDIQRLVELAGTTIVRTFTAGAPEETGSTGGRKKGRRKPRAQGGEVVAGSLYSVLEQGRDEWFVPHQTGRVYNEAQMRAGMAPAAGGNSAPNVALTVHGLPMRARTPLDVVHQVRRAGRLGVLIAEPARQFAEVPR